VIRIPAVLLLAFALYGVSPAISQEPSQENEVPGVELMAGYSYLHSSSINFNGWKATLVYNVNPWLGIAADIDGHYAGGESEHSLTFGPHFALRKNERWTPFGFALLGVVMERSVSGETENGFAAEVGGGLDYEVSSPWALQLGATASITHVGEETHVSPKISLGVVYSFGRK